MIHSIADAEQYLYTQTPKSKKRAFTGDEGLNAAKAFFAHIGNPQDNGRAIHIAGTSGKGSVAYILSALLVGHGYKVGTHSSPHFYDIRERFLIDLKPLPSIDFVEITQEIKEAVEKLKSDIPPPSFFVLTNAIAFRAFQKNSVDYSVIETGIGGLYDSTNSISRGDKIAIITRLGFDHTEILGNSLEEIATQKAGIIQRGNSVICLEPEDAAAKSQVVNRANSMQADLTFVNVQNSINNIQHGQNGVCFDFVDDRLSLISLETSLFGDHQAENTAVALRSFLKLAQRDTFEVNETIVRSVLKNISIPGRFEYRKYGNITIILDGAHNPQKIEALFKTTREYFGNEQQLSAVVAFKNDKDIPAMLRLIRQYSNSIIISNYSFNPDTEIYKPADLGYIAAIATNLGFSDVVVCSKPDQLINIIEKRPPMTTVITGSIYFVGEIGNRMSHGN